MSDTNFGNWNTWPKIIIISHLKLFSFSRCLNFCLEFLVVLKNGWIRKIRLISKFMTSQPGQQTIAIHILINISISKANPVIKFGMRNIFLENPYTKPFFKKPKLNKSLDQETKVLYSLFCQAEDYQNILKLSCRPHKEFFKNKNKTGTSPSDSFSAWFLKKNISVVIFDRLTKFHCLVALTSWDVGHYVYCNYLLTRFWSHKFWN